MDNREERIRQKAHEIWERAGRPDDKAKDHWAEAERQVEREDHKGDADKLGNEPNPRGEAVAIGPSPNGDIQTIPTAAGSAGRGRR
jgi:hypothetical protein